ncbi:hypothetical protein BDV97DRAFT_371735 [Delphinella strobiligena]|nr:hypothetical protein BDV97DRAFT_371735 [Delphinella strobiligena]
MSSLFDSIHNPSHNRAQQSILMPPPAPEHQTPNLVSRFNQLQAAIDADWTQFIQHIAQQDAHSDDIQSALKTATSIDHYLATGIHETEQVPITLFIPNPTPYQYQRAMLEKKTGCLRSAQSSIGEYVRLDEVIRDSVVALEVKEANLRALRGRILQSRAAELEVMKGKVEALLRARSFGLRNVFIDHRFESGPTLDASPGPMFRPPFSLCHTPMIDFMLTHLTQRYKPYTADV